MEEVLPSIRRTGGYHATGQIDYSDPRIVAGVIEAQRDRIATLEARVDEMQPAVDAHARIAAADGSLCITDAAKALQMRPKDLFSYLSQNGWIYKRPGAAHWLGYQSKVQAALLVHKLTTVLTPDGDERVTEQVRVTPRGITQLAKLIKPLTLIQGDLAS